MVPSNHELTTQYFKYFVDLMEIERVVQEIEEVHELEKVEKYQLRRKEGAPALATTVDGEKKEEIRRTKISSLQEEIQGIKDVQQEILRETQEMKKEQSEIKNLLVSLINKLTSEGRTSMPSEKVIEHEDNIDEMVDYAAKYAMVKISLYFFTFIFSFK